MAHQSYGGSTDRFSIVISNTVRPYAYEINNILALPSGFRYHCRYRQRWVHMDQPTDRMPRTNGLVILRCFQDGRFFPIRRIQVETARKVGDILYVEYLLRDWIKLSSSLEERQRQVHRFNELVAAGLSSRSEPGANLDRLVFFGTDFCYFLEDWSATAGELGTDDERWGNLVDELRRIAVYQQYDFLKVVQLRDEHQRQVPIIDGVGYRLRPSGTYELEMLQRRHLLASNDEASASNRLIRLLMNEQDYLPIENTFSVSGRYDIIRFRFQTTSNRLRKYSFMLIRNEPSTHSRDVDEDGPPRSGPAPSPLIGPIPDILVPSVIDQTRGQLGILAARIAAALLLFTAYVAPQVLLGPALANGALRIAPGPAAIPADAAERGLSQLALLLLVLVLTGSFSDVLKLLTSRLR